MGAQRGGRDLACGLVLLRGGGALLLDRVHPAGQPLRAAQQHLVGVGAVVGRDGLAVEHTQLREQLDGVRGVAFHRDEGRRSVVAVLHRQVEEGGDGAQQLELAEARHARAREREHLQTGEPLQPRRRLERVGLQPQLPQRRQVTELVAERLDAVAVEPEPLQRGAATQAGWAADLVLMEEERVQPDHPVQVLDHLDLVAAETEPPERRAEVLQLGRHSAHPRVHQRELLQLLAAEQRGKRLERRE